MKHLRNNKMTSIIFFMALLLSISNAKSQNVWTLQQCIDSTLVNNKSLKIKKNDLRISTQKEKEVKTNLLPKISLNGDYRYYTDLPTQLMPLSVFGGPEGQFKEARFGVQHNINANIMLNMALYSPEIFGAIKKTKIASELSELNYQKTKEEIYFDLSYYYYNAQIVKNQIQFIQNNLANSEELLKVMVLLNEQLLVTKTDVNKVKLQVQQLQTKQLVAENNYQQILNGMKLLMGVDLKQDFSVDPKIDLKSTINYQVNKTSNMQMNEVQNKLLNNDLSTLQRSRYLPSIFLYGSYGQMGYGYTESPNEFLNFYTVGFLGVKMSFSLFNGTTTLKKINQKNIEVENNELQKMLLASQNEVQINNADLQISITRELVESSELQIELAQSVYEQVLLQQKEGVANITEVLLADSALREAQQSYISAIINYYKADLDKRKLTGNI